MTILAVDNENLMLNRLCRHIKQIKPDSLVVSFKNPADALAYMENHTVDVVFLEIIKVHFYLKILQLDNA